MIEEFCAVFIAFYAGHHVGDYWVQTHHQAQHKGDAGKAGRIACIDHVVTYYLTQAAMLVLLVVTFRLPWSWGWTLALFVSAISHYMADRREYGVMFALAHAMPWKSSFLRLGTPRPQQTLEMWGPCPSCEGRGSGGAAADESTNGMCWDCRAGGMLPSHVVINDNPQLATGAWALDQSWHIFWGVFIAALAAVQPWIGAGALLVLAGIAAAVKLTR